MQRILVVRNDKIGDFMLAWPSFAMLKASCDCHVTALVPAYNRAAGRTLPLDRSGDTRSGPQGALSGAGSAAKAAQAGRFRCRHHPLLHPAYRLAALA